MILRGREEGGYSQKKVVERGIATLAPKGRRGRGGEGGGGKKRSRGRVEGERKII